MKHYLQVEMVAMVEFTDEEWNVIMECCRHHYDYKVKTSTEKGGFLYGAQNHRDWCKDGEDKTDDFTFRQLDTICKGLEMSQSPLRDEIYSKIHNILKDINKTGVEINDNLKKSYEKAEHDHQHGVGEGER